MVARITATICPVGDLTGTDATALRSAPSITWRPRVLAGTGERAISEIGIGDPGFSALPQAGVVSSTISR